MCVGIPGRGIPVCACNVIRSSLLTMQMSHLGALVFQEMIALCVVAFCFLTIAGIQVVMASTPHVIQDQTKWMWGRGKCVGQDVLLCVVLSCIVLFMTIPH